MPLTPDLPFDDTLLERLLPDSVAVALRGESPEAFFAWMRARLSEDLAPPLDLFTPRDLLDGVDDSVLDVFAWQLGRAIWNALPLPGNNFRPRPLSNPGRNDPCPCGSGAKFKQCCGRLPALPTLDPAALWPFVLEQLDRDVLEAALERAAFWARRLRKRHGEGLEVLLSHLDAIAADPVSAFAEMASEMPGGAGEGLQTWLATVRDRPVPAYALADEAAPVEDMQALRDSLQQRLRGMGVGGDQLEQMLDQALRAFEEEQQSLPEDDSDVEKASDLADDEPPTDCITAPESIRTLEGDWHRVFPLEKPFSVNDTPFGDTDPWDPAIEARWGAWLEAHPAAFDSLDILDDIATALHLHPQFGAAWLDDLLLGPVLSRAAAIADQAIADRPEPRLEWPWTGNRPALRSLVRLGWLHQRAGRQEQDFALTERLVALNPHDNHGLRAELMRGYLASGRDDAALALAAKFPDDALVEITFGRALALFRLGRRDEATAALRDALEHSPKVGKFLLAEKRRKPRIDPHGVRFGGDDEAWLYREAMRETWQATPGAMAWLGEVSRGRA